VTTFVSGSQLTVQINAADIQNQGSASITVANPTAGTVSNALLFTITSATSASYFVYLPLIRR